MQAGSGARYSMRVESARPRLEWGTFTTAERKAIKENKVTVPLLQRDHDTGEVLPADLQ